MLHFTPHIKTETDTPDHRYCALHESLSAVRGVQCIVGWSYTHARTVLYPFISPLQQSLSLYIKERGEGVLNIEQGKVNEYRTPFPFYLLYTHFHVSCSVRITSPAVCPSLYPSLVPFPSIHVPFSSAVLLWSLEQPHTPGWWLP